MSWADGTMPHVRRSQSRGNQYGVLDQAVASTWFAPGLAGF